MSPLILAIAAGLVLQQPTFRSGVDLLRMDAAVVDGNGRPVRDLRPEDFVVTVDGSPRRVAFARFYGPDDTPRTGDVQPVSSATNLAAPQGRVLVLVVDVESIIPGHERLILDTAGTLVDRLGPSDAVGLLVLQGPSVEVTRDHDRVRKALATLRGSAAPPANGYRMSIREAEGFRAGNKGVISQVMERECRPTDAGCLNELQQMVMPMLVEAERHTRLVLPALTTLLERLERVEAPRAVVLLSAGFQRNTGSNGYVRDLEQRANTAGVRMSIVQIEQPEYDVSYRGGAGGASRDDLVEGLSAIGGATEAEMYYGVGKAAGAFERIRDEILHSYELGIDSTPSDPDGRKHRLKIEVKRSGLTVRARKQFVVSSQRQPSSNPVEVLSHPVDFAEAPMAVSTYTTRGDEASTLKVVFLIEALAAAPRDGVISYALSVSDQSKKVIFETADRFATGNTSTAISTQVAPGRYRLRAALIDAAGRRGSLEMPIAVGLRQAGTLQFSDLIVGQTGAPFPVTSRLAAGTTFSALLEMFSADPAQLDGLTVTFEARRAGETAPAARALAEIRKTSLERRRMAAAEGIDASLRPGTWIVSAVVRRGQDVVGQVSRTIVVEPPREGSPR
jgi:VWFA-related protein